MTCSPPPLSPCATPFAPGRLAHRLWRDARGHLSVGEGPGAPRSRIPIPQCVHPNTYPVPSTAEVHPASSAPALRALTCTPAPCAGGRSCVHRARGESPARRLRARVEPAGVGRRLPQWGSRIHTQGLERERNV